MLSIFLLIPLSLMLFVVAIWAVRYAVKSNQFEDLDNASQRIILDDRQERRQVLQSHEPSNATEPVETMTSSDNMPADNEVQTDASKTHVPKADKADKVGLDDTSISSSNTDNHKH